VLRVGPKPCRAVCGMARPIPCEQARPSAASGAWFEALVVGDISKARAQSMSPGHHLVQGTVLVFLAEALFPLTGLITASFLTRSLGAGNYGLLTLTATLITWVEIAIVSLFDRTMVKAIGEAEDWNSIGAVLLRLHLLVGIAATVACWLLAKPCAVLFGEPGLASCLAIYAVDIPIFALAHAYRNILIGTGRFAGRASTSAGRWITRLILIVLLVELGFSVRGAILGGIGASLAELVIARHYVRPSWSAPAAAPVTIWDYALPVFLATLILRVLDMGLLLLKILGASAAQAGIYGAAQNVSFIMPAILALSLSPLLLSTMTRVKREGDLPAARTLAFNAIRAVVGMLPFAVVAAAASDEVAILLFGAQFADAGPLLAILVFAGLAIMMINLLSAIMIACGKPSWTLGVAAPLLPAALAGHLLAIPRFGPIGAASVTAVVASLGAFAGLLVVCRYLRIQLPTVTLIRSVLLSLMVYPLVSFWPAHGLAVMGKMAVAAVAVLGGFIALRELRQDEIDFVRSILRKSLSGKSAMNVHKN